MASIKLEIVSPDKVVYTQDIAMLIVRSTGGELGILPHHAPLVAVAGGFMEVTPEKITVLASAAEQPIDIDINRAKQAYARAKERIAKFHQGSPASDDIDFKRAELALHRAMARLQATKTEFEG